MGSQISHGTSNDALVNSLAASYNAKCEGNAHGIQIADGVDIQIKNIDCRGCPEMCTVSAIQQDVALSADCSLNATTAYIADVLSQNPALAQTFLQRNRPDIVWDDDEVVSRLLSDPSSIRNEVTNTITSRCKNAASAEQIVRDTSITLDRVICGNVIAIQQSGTIEAQCGSTLFNQSLQDHFGPEHYLSAQLNGVHGQQISGSAAIITFLESPTGIAIIVGVVLLLILALGLGFGLHHHQQQKPNQTNQTLNQANQTNQTLNQTNQTLNQTNQNQIPKR